MYRTSPQTALAAGPAGRRPETEDHDGGSTPLESSLSPKRASMVQSKLNANAPPSDHAGATESSLMMSDKITRVVELCVNQVTEESNDAAHDDESSIVTDSESENVESSNPKKPPLTDKEKKVKKREKKRKKKEKKAKKKAKKEARKASHERNKIVSQSSDPNKERDHCIVQEKHQEIIQKGSTGTTCSTCSSLTSSVRAAPKQQDPKEEATAATANATAAIAAPALSPKSTEPASQPPSQIDRKMRPANGGERRPSGRPQVTRVPVDADNSSSVNHPCTLTNRSGQAQPRTGFSSDKLQSKMINVDSKTINVAKRFIDAERVNVDKNKKEIDVGDYIDVEKGDRDPENEAQQEYIMEIFDKRGVDQDSSEDYDDFFSEETRPGAFKIQGNRPPSMQSTIVSANNETDNSRARNVDADLGAPLVAHLVPEYETSYDKIVVAVEDDEPARRRRLWFVVAGLLVVFLVVVIVLGVVLDKSPAQPPPEEPSLWYHVVDPIDGETDSGEFGSSISMCSDGSRVAIGAQGSGEVKVFELNVEGRYTKQIGQTLNHSLADMAFGLNTSIIRSRIVVELASDCHVLAIGCPFCNVDNKTAAGEVGLYEYNSTSDSWEPLGKPHVIHGGGEGDFSGASLALSHSGDRIVIGSPGSDWAGVNAGLVRVFHFNHDVWELLGMPINGTFSREEFGVSVSLANKQTSATSIIAVGSSFTKDTCGGPEGPVAVRAYEFRTGDWFELGQGIVPEVFGVDTAWFVKLSSNGKRLVISNLYLDPDGIGINEDNEGLYVAPFELDSQGNKWVPLGGNLHRYFPGKKSGYMISLSEDGQRIGMGDPGRGGINGGFLGHTHFFEFMEGNKWCQLGPKVLGAAPGDMTGYSLSLSGDGKRMAIASPKSRFQGYEHGQVMVVELHEDIIVPMCNVTTLHNTTIVEGAGGRWNLCKNHTG